MAFKDSSNSQQCKEELKSGNQIRGKLDFDENKCPICLSSPQNNKSKPDCGHVFCFECLKTWSTTYLGCPVCKQSFTSFIHSIQSSEEYQVYKPTIADEIKCKMCSISENESLFMSLLGDNFCVECGLRHPYFDFLNYWTTVDSA